MKKQFLIIGALIIGSFVLVSMTVVKTISQDPWVAPDKYQKMENPEAANADAEKIGRMLYSKHCKSCHGSKGKGDGSKAETVDTPIGDFTDGSIANQTDGSLYYKTFEGRDDMPSFKKKIKDQTDQWLIINYLKKLAQ